MQNPQQQMLPGVQQYMQYFAATPDLQLRTLQDQRSTLTRAEFILGTAIPVAGVLGALWFAFFSRVSLSNGWIMIVIFLGIPLTARFGSLKTIKINIERIDYQIGLVKAQIANGG